MDTFFSLNGINATDEELDILQNNIGINNEEINNENAEDNEIVNINDDDSAPDIGSSISVSDINSDNNFTEI